MQPDDSNPVNIPWGMQNIQPGSMKTISTTKIATFAVGQQKKSRFQREREENEKRKKQEEEEARKAYDSFAASFGVAEPMDAPQRSAPLPFASSSITLDDAPKSAKAPVIHRTIKGQGSEMQKMLEEMKEREKGRAELADQFEHIDDDGDDPTSTNLYLRSLCSTVQEADLSSLFSAYGPIHSVKILWPRQGDDMTRQFNCGFVSYFHREHASAAMHGLNNREVHGHPINITWGKAVKLPPTRAATNFGRPSAPPVHYPSPHVPTPPVKSVPVTPVVAPQPTSAPPIVIQMPYGQRTRRLIDLTARFVAKDGESFENELKQREKKNIDFSFLFETESDLGRYYRWRVYAYICGEGDVSWRCDPFRYSFTGPLIQPPTLPREEKEDEVDASIYMSEADRQREAYLKRREHMKHALAFSELQELQAKIQNLTVRRKDVCDLMAFALDKATMAEDVVDVLKGSFFEMEAPPPLMIARLYVISDLLHNSGAPVKNASMYRTQLQQALPEIFDQLSVWKRCVTGRMSTSQLNDRIMGLLRVWDDWGIFPADYLRGLESTFYRTEADVIKHAGVKVDDSVDLYSLQRQSRLTGLMTAKYDPKSGESVQLTGSELQAQLNYFTDYCSRHGYGHDVTLSSSVPTAGTSSPIDDIDGVPIDDIDGVPLDDDIDGIPLDDDVDGIPLDDDIDGVPLDEGSRKRRRSDSNLSDR